VKVVLDANVLLAATIADGLCRQVLRHCLVPEALITSQPILIEYAERLTNKFHLDPRHDPFWQRFVQRAEVVRPPPLAQATCRDRDDDWVLATAQMAAADVIVTGDADLLTLHSFAGIPIVTPRRFLEMLAAQE
jgi:putative PIN family toxin of toxin-antitoxin system